MEKLVCPVDDKECVRNSVCKLWYGSNKCWYKDFYALIKAFFNSDDKNNIVFNVGKTDNFGLKIFLDYCDKFDTSSIFMVVRMNFSSHRLAEKVRQHFCLLNWCIQLTSLEIKYELQYKTKNEVEEKLIFVKELVCKIIKHISIVFI